MMVETYGIDLERIARHLAAGRFRITDGMLEKRCGRCGDYWPADREFFYSSTQCACGLHTFCRACFLEARSTPGRSRAAAAAA